jgi:hypothetical protein
MFAGLREGPLDIVGDVHGERQALQNLLHHLGCDESGRHRAGRRLVFVGDLCDRGPDSPGAIEIVRRVVEEGRGDAILGNHELNLLRAQRKDGNDWFWDEGTQRDRKYEPTAKPGHNQRQAILDFFASLPLTLERDDLRVVHAAWDAVALTAMADMNAGGVVDHFEALEQQAEAATLK